MKIEEIEKDFNYKYQIKEMNEYKDGDFERLNYENPQEVVLNFISKIHTQALKQGREDIKKDLLAIAEAGEYEELRREVEDYFKNLI